MKRKFGLIVVFPNCILDDPEDTSEMFEYIEKYMNIDLRKCYIKLKHEFDSDTTFVRLTSSESVMGLTEHIHFGNFIHERFPTEKLI